MPDEKVNLGDLRLVDPELLPLLRSLSSDSLTAETLAARRDRLLPLTLPAEEGVDTKRFSVLRSPAPDLQMWMYRPAGVDDRAPCIYHMHGGGFVLGSAYELRHAHARLAKQLACVIVSVEYRLAPEALFPAAIEDCFAGLVWLFENASGLGLDADRIGVMGESAGGGLAAALTLLARDRGGPIIAFQHLTYPMLDDRTGASRAARTQIPVWNVESNRFAWSAMLGCEPGSPNISPYAAASRADDLSQLPPAFLSVGALDLFLDENIDYARRLACSGVPVELHVYPGAFHGFELAAEAAVSRTARRDSREALRRSLSRSSARLCQTERQ